MNLRKVAGLERLSLMTATGSAQPLLAISGIIDTGERIALGKVAAFGWAWAVHRQQDHRQSRRETVRRLRASSVLALGLPGLATAVALFGSLGTYSVNGSAKSVIVGIWHKVGQRASGGS